MSRGSHFTIISAGMPHSSQSMLLTILNGMIEKRTGIS